MQNFLNISKELQNTDFIKMNLERRHFASIDSTQLYARQFIEQALISPILITSAVQTHGMGQRGRVWQSPLGNLHMSLVCHLPHMNTLYIAQIVALSLVYALHTYSIFPQIKWVNDIFLHDKKLGGILCENHDQVYIIGIGLNVNEMVLADQPTISLKQETGKNYEIEGLLDAIMTRFKKDLYRR